MTVPGPVKCASCGQAYAASMAVCPQCKAPNPAPVMDGELFRRIAEVGAAEGERERRATRGRRIAGFVAFALSLITVVPALLVMFVTAKRWGRVPFVLIVVDVVILTLATYGTRLFPLVAISAIASVLVFVLRYAQLEQGVALGYSSAVITPAMLGGALLMGSIFTMGVSGHLSANLDRWFPITRTAQDVAGLPPGAVTGIDASEIRWDEAMFCAPDRCVPVTEETPSGATERWAPMDSRGSTWVAMPAAASTLSTSVGVTRTGEYTRGDLAQRRWPSDWRGPDAVSVVAIGLEEAPPAPPIFAGATMGALLALVLGLAACGLALGLAWRET